MLFSELYKIMVNEVTFVGLRVDDSPNRPLLDQPWAQQHLRPYYTTEQWRQVLAMILL